MQAAGTPLPVRVWRADSTAYVTLREPGHFVLLHVDAIGRIRVLFPQAPDDTTSISGDGGEPLAIPLPPSAQGNPSTLFAIRSRWPFEFAALQAGSTWNYHDALLLQPTAGDPLAALLDIAERVTDGRPYDYGVVTYTRAGTLDGRRVPRQPPVIRVRRRAPVAVAATVVSTNAVDCSNASLTNSFCGVANANVSITSVPQVAYQPAPPPPTAPAPVYVPYYLPIVVVHGEHRRFERPIPPPPSAPQPSAAAAFPIAPRLIVPSTSELRSLTGRRRP